MKYNPDKHHRKSIRLKNYNYSNIGSYFITVCAYNHECLFGDIEDGRMQLNNCGRIIESEWLRSSEIRKEIELDIYQTMPNHLHGIIIITECPNNHVGAIHELPLQNNDRIARRKMLIPKIIGRFKMNSSKQINVLRKSAGVPVWKRNYYDHIIRNENELNQIREYIINNPLKWEFDEDNPKNRVKP